MSSHHLLPDEPSDTRERIMLATYRALTEYGYAGLSLQRIADESELSKSSIYHFYDGKEDLLLAFMEFMIERWRDELAFSRTGDPVVDLRTNLVFAATGSTPEGVPDRAGSSEASRGAFVELRAQAVTDDAYRSRITDLDEVFVAGLAAIIEDGVEEGVFRDVDPEATAGLLHTLMLGVLFRQPTVEKFDGEMVSREMNNLLDRYLLVGEQ